LEPAVFKCNLAWYLLSFFVLPRPCCGAAVRGRICAFGRAHAVDGPGRAAQASRQVPAEARGRRANTIKYGLLVAVLVYFVATRDVAVYRYVEPFWMFGLFGTTPMWIGLAVLLLATVFVRNLYCRFLCPVGALLGVISKLTVFKIKRWSECNTCKICEKTCEWGAIRGPKIIEAECVRCDDCERLYLDQQKCPHWIILRRKGDKLFVSS
jgi:polyferredoxin